MWYLALWILTASLVTSEGLANSPVALVHDSTDHIIVTLKAADPTLSVSSVDGVSYAELSIHGFTLLGELGGPALPTFTKLIAIPYGKKAIVSVIAEDKGTFTIEQNHLVPFKGIRRHCGEDHNLVSASPDKYASFKNKPAVTIGETSFLGPVRIAPLVFNPVRIFPNSKKFELIRKATIRVSFENDPAKQIQPPVNPLGLTSRHYKFFRSMVLNHGVFPRFARTDSIPTDLMIVHMDYLNDVRKLIEFKESQGRGVIVKPFTNPTHREVIEYIKTKYQSSTPPDHTLIIGNIDQIPSFRRGNFWSDYNYSLLDSGSFPDISIGRLAANTSTELQEVISKIIARETSDRVDGKFLVTSGFETSWCHENLDYISEKIFKHSQIEIEVDKRYASDGHRTSSILTGFNANPNIIIYDGHGSQDGMTEIPFYIRHLRNLSNQSFPIILDIACLNSYWPSAGAAHPNFADRIFTLPSHGAAGIFSSSFYSGGHDLFRHLLRAAIYDDQSTSEPYHLVNEIGWMIQFGKVKYLEQYNGTADALEDNYMFYYHGDPASTFFSDRR